MSTNRIVRIVVGSALIGYAIYSGIAWFYLGAFLLVTGVINWCFLETRMGTCDPKSGCCASNTQETSGSSCCSSKSEETKQSACCAPKKDATTAMASTVSSFKAVQPLKDGSTLIEILGTGCSKCIALEKVVQDAVKSLNGDYEVKKVSDLEEIMAYNVVSTPSLVINGTVVSTGKLLTIDEVKKILQA